MRLAGPPRTLLSPVRAAATAFDGVDQRLFHNGDLGEVDAKVGTISLWIKKTGEDAVTQRIFSNQSDRCYMEFGGSNLFEFRGLDTLSAIATKLVCATAITADDTWHHICMSWDNANSLKHVYLDGSEDERTASTQQADAEIDYSRDQKRLGSTGSGGGSFLNACMYEFYFNQAEYVDLSVAANLAKFINAAGTPVWTGHDGSLPTGTAPIYLHRGGVADFKTNLGSGGGLYTEEGTAPFADCLTVPFGV